MQGWMDTEFFFWGGGELFFFFIYSFVLALRCRALLVYLVLFI